MFAKPGRSLYIPLVLAATLLTFLPLYPSNGYVVSLYSTVPLWLMLGILLFFLRDPERPLGTPGGITSPADGYVVGITEGDEKASILIELHVTSVHVQRTPLSGKISRVERVKGEYQRVYFIKKKLNGESEAIQKNARTIIEIENPDGPRTSIELIAGALARRCIPYVKPGDLVQAGQRVGMILFGSLVRIDLFSKDYEPVVEIGARVFGNRTVLFKKKKTCPG